MAGNPKYGSTSAGFADAIARMQTQEAAITSLEAKEAQLQAIEERGTGATRTNITARLDAAAAIERQVAAISPLSAALEREIGVLGANTKAWQANAVARGVASGATDAGLAAGAGTGSVGRTAGAAASSAELDAKLAASQVAAAAAAQRVLRDSQALGQRFGQAPQLAIAGGQQRALPPGAPYYAPGTPGTYLGEPGALRLGERPGAGAFVGGPGGFARTSTRVSSLAGPSGTFDTAAIGEYSAAEERMIAVNARVQASIAGVTAEQLAANAAFSQSVAEYSASSQALTRHGALSTEFIGSFVRGEATLNEFGSALSATIGKFAGWAVAGGLVYGAFEALKKVADGAKDTATGVAQLERAGLPNFNKAEAEEGFRQVAQRTNVPIKEVAEAQFYAARAGIHDQGESLKVGETAVLAQKLDQVPIQEAAKSLGALHIAFGLNADGIRQVFNELDVGQLKFNARLNQTLPQLGRAASAFANAGGTAHQLATQLVEVTGATGGGGGQGGGNPATLFIREPSNIAKPGSIATLRQLGLDPKRATEHIGEFNEEIQEKAKNYNKDQIRELAKAIGGGSAIGGRYGIALIEGGPSGRAAEVKAGLANAGGSADQDLKHKLAQFDEELSAVGHTFERIGSEVGRSGVTTVAQDFLVVLKLVAEGLEKATKPLSRIGDLVNAVPAPLQDAALLGLVGAGASRFARSDKALGLSRPLGEIPGLGALDSESRQQLRDLKRGVSAGLERSRAQIESSGAALAGASEGKVTAVGAKSAFLASAETPTIAGGASQAEIDAFNARVAAYDDAINVAASRELVAKEALVSKYQIREGLVAQQEILENKNLSAQQRVLQAAEKGAVAAPAGGGYLVGGAGAVGAQAEAKARTEAAAGIVTGGAAVTEGLDRAAVGATEGAAVIGGSFGQAAFQIREGGAQVAGGLKLAAEEIVAAGSLSAGAAGGRAALGGGAALFGGLGAGASSALSGVTKNLFKGFMVATIGSLIAETVGGAIGGKTGKAVGGIGSDIAIGAGAGALFGAPEVGAVAGGLYGLAKETEGPGEGLDALVARVKVAEAKAREAGARKLLGAPAPSSHAENLENIAASYGSELEVAFKDESEAAQKAKGQIEKHLRIIGANLKLFGQSSARGKAIQDELQGDLAASLDYLTKNPANIDVSTEHIEKLISASTGESKASFGRALKTAQAPQDILSAQSVVENTNQGLYQQVPNAEKKIREELAVAQQGQSSAEKGLASGRGDPAALKKKLEASRKEVESFQRTLKTFHEAAPRIIQALNESNEEAAEGAFKALNEQAAPANARKLAEAGANTGQRTKVEAQIEQETLQHGQEAYKGKYPKQEKALREEQTATRVAREQKQATEQVEKIEESGKKHLAELPAGDTVGAARVKANTAAETLKYIKANKDNAFGWKQLKDAEIANIEAKKAVEEAIRNEQTEIVSLQGQISQASDQGNAVAQAGDAAATAAKLVGLAKTQKERLQAQLGLINAANQLQQALQAQISAAGELAESRTTDPLQQDRIKLQTDRRLLAHATPDERVKLEAGKNKDQQKYAADLVSNKESEIEFHKTMGDISTQTAIEQYESLLKLHTLTKRERQDILTKIRGLQNEIGVGNNQVYDLAPGKIKLPTAYDVQRAIGSAAHAQAIIHSPTENHNQINEFKITVNENADIHKVADALDRALHSGVRARLRSAGVRGR